MLYGGQRQVSLYHVLADCIRLGPIEQTANYLRPDRMSNSWINVEANALERVVITCWSNKAAVFVTWVLRFDSCLERFSTQYQPLPNRCFPSRRPISMRRTWTQIVRRLSRQLLLDLPVQLKN